MGVLLPAGRGLRRGGRHRIDRDLGVGQCDLVLVATPVGWYFQPEPGSQCVASLSMTTDQAWRLLSNNLPVDEQSSLRLIGDERVLGVLRKTRAIVGAPK